MNKKPNVILVITDDQGYGDLGCTGNPWVKTPAIDTFAAQSLRCENFHVQPMCTPSRAALMSGRRPLRNGAWATCWGRSILKAGQTTMAEMFAQGGYRTAMFGKWHLGDTYPYRPQDRGFQHVVTHKGGGVGQVPDFWGNSYFDDTYFHNGQPTAYPGYCTDVWFGQAKRFIADCGEQPFFCYVATNAPHSPFLVEERYAAPYRGVEAHGVRDAAFFGMIANIDENFAALQAFLDERGLTDNTMLIFMTDNGTAAGCRCDGSGHVTGGYNAGMRGMKGSYYEGGHRVPCFVRWPAGGIGGGRETREMCLDIDLMPTLADLCGLASPADIDGLSVAPVWRGQRDVLDGDREHFIVYHQGTEPPSGKHSCVLTRRWRLVCGTELYDILADPGQQQDVAAAHPAVVARLQSAFAAWWNSLADDLPRYAPLAIGHPAENPTRLDAMDVMGDMVWQQASVAEAHRTAGRWWVRVDQPGRYRFALHRWPPELDLGIDEGISPEAASRLLYPRADRHCQKLAPVAGSVAITDQYRLCPVQAGDKACVIDLDLAATGETELKALFHDVDGATWGAYYVTVERKGPMETR